MSDTIFTKIIRRELPAMIRYEDEQFIAFDDINPSAPIDILIVTKEPFATLNEIPLERTDILAGLFKAVRQTATAAHMGDNYRLVMNVGSQMQLVPHVHIHLMGGWNQTSLKKVRTKNI